MKKFLFFAALVLLCNFGECVSKKTAATKDSKDPLSSYQQLRGNSEKTLRELILEAKDMQNSFSLEEFGEFIMNKPDIGTLKKTILNPKLQNLQKQEEANTKRKSFSEAIPLKGHNLSTMILPKEKNYTGLIEKSKDEFPLFQVVSIYFSASKGSGRCTGALITDFEVVTSGHCLFDRDANKWVSNIWVIPTQKEYDSLQQNTGVPFASSWQSITTLGWDTVRGHYDLEYDYAIITLERKIESDPTNSKKITSPSLKNINTVMKEIFSQGTVQYRTDVWEFTGRDLVGNLKSVPSEPVLAGGSMIVYFHLVNLGLIPSGIIRVSYYYSTLPHPTSNLVFFDSHSFASLNCNSYSNISVSLTAPRVSGHRYLFAQFSPENSEYIKDLEMRTIYLGKVNISHPSNQSTYDRAPRQSCFSPYGSYNSQVSAYSYNGGTISGRLCALSETNWFRFHLSSLSVISVTCDFNNNNGDIELELRSSSGTIDSSSGTGNSETVSSETSVSSGYYYVRVYLYQGGTISSSGAYYYLSFSISPNCVSPYRYYNSQVSAYLYSGGTINGRLCSLSEVNWFRFYVSSPSDISVTCNFINNNGDIELELRSSSETIDSSTGTGNSETVSESSASIGYYYVRVYLHQASFSLNGVSYSLSFSISPNCVSPYGSYNSQVSAYLYNGGTISGRLCASSEVNWFRFYVSSPSDISVTCDFNNNNGDIELELRSSSGTIDSSSGTGNSETVSSETSVSSGYYYVRVYLYQGGTISSSGASYSLSFSTSPSCTSLYGDNSSKSKAYYVSVFSSTSFGAKLCQSNEENWFRFSVSSDGDIEVEIQFDHERGDVDASLRSSSNTLDTSNSQSDREHLSASVVSGDYWIQITVFTLSNPAGVPYTISISHTPSSSSSSSGFTSNIGMIVGITAGGFVGLSLIIVASIFLVRFIVKSRKKPQEELSYEPPPSYD